MGRSKVFSAVVLCSTVLLALAKLGAGIRCWDCNSKFDPRCANENFSNYTLATIDCKQVSYSHLEHLEAKYCRKVVQDMGTGEKRTIRGCGWLDDKRADETFDGCYSRTGSKGVMVTFCSCKTDSCNSAPGGASTSYVVMAAAAFFGTLPVIF